MCSYAHFHEEFSFLQSTAVYIASAQSILFVGEKMVLRASCTHPISTIVYTCPKSSINFLSMRKRSETFWFASIAFISALKSNIDLESLNYWFSEKLNCFSVLSSWMLLGFLFIFLFIVTRASLRMANPGSSRVSRLPFELLGALSEWRNLTFDPRPRGTPGCVQDRSGYVGLRSATVLNNTLA